MTVPQDPAPAESSAAAAAPAQRSAAMRFIMVAVLLDMVAIGIMFPVLPHFVERFLPAGNDELAKAMLVLSVCFGVANFFASPILGALSDRNGRRTVLLIGFLGMALSFFGTAAATSFAMLIVMRLLSGSTQANVSVANAYVADITPPDQRAARFGALGAMFGIGFILGPALGGVLGGIDIRLPFVVAGSLALLNALYGFFVVPESLPVERRSGAFDWKKANPISALRGLTQTQGIGSLVAVIALSSLAQFMLHSVWVLYGKFRFGWGPREVGWSLFAVGVVSAISQGVVMRRLLTRMSARTLVLWSLAVGALSYLGFALARDGWQMYVVILFGLVGGAANAAIQSIVSSAADERTQGRTMGAVSSLNSLMAVIAPVIGLELLRWVSHLPPHDWRLGLPFFGSAVLMASALVLAVRFFARHPHLGQAPARKAPAADAAPADAAPTS